MRVFLSFLFFVLVSFAAIAQQPNIFFQGQTDNASGKKVTLSRYNDPLSLTEMQIDEAVIADDGTFRLKAYANYPMLVVVQIENYSQSFYAEPGRTYEMYLPEFDWDMDEKINVNLAPVALPFQFLNLPANELNLSIARFDEVVDSFVYENRLHLDFRFRPEKTYFDTLMQTVERLCPNTDNEYFNRYKQYHLAALQCEMGFASRTKLYDQYIRNQPIRYYDDNYMRLFLTLFRNRISKGSRYLKIREIAEFVDRLDLGHFLDSLGLDPLLRNEQVRELAALQALSEAYYRSFYFRSDKVLRMIELLGERTKFNDHKVLASHLLEKFHAEEPTAVMPQFTLPDVDKNPVRLSDFKGRWVYLSFVRVGEPDCIGELETMAHFYDSVCGRDSNVVFVTIDCDREFQKMYHLLRNSRKGSRYRWTWLHFDGNYKLLEKYQVASYPTFILINPKGEKQYSVTRAPSTGFLLNGPWRRPNEESEKPRSFLNQY